MRRPSLNHDTRSEKLYFPPPSPFALPPSSFRRASDGEDPARGRRWITTRVPAPTSRHRRRRARRARRDDDARRRATHARAATFHATAWLDTLDLSFTDNDKTPRPAAATTALRIDPHSDDIEHDGDASGGDSPRVWSPNPLFTDPRTTTTTTTTHAQKTQLCKRDTGEEGGAATATKRQPRRRSRRSYDASSASSATPRLPRMRSRQRR